MVDFLDGPLPDTQITIKSRMVEHTVETGFGPVRVRRPEFFYATNQQGSAGRDVPSSAGRPSSPSIQRTTGDR